MSVRNETPTSYPLSWPIGRKRTARIDRRKTPFKSGKSEISVFMATNRLMLEIERLRATSAILSTNLELRLDGTPRSDRRAPDDPGAALYFKWNDKDVVLACDSYDTVAGNIAALAAHIEATRAIERYGVGTLEQMFTGFTALPPGGSSIAVADWRAELGNPNSLDEAEIWYQRCAKIYHPDVPDTGDTKKMTALNAAIGFARKYWSTR